LVCAFCLAFCSCGISEDEAVGTWSGTYTYNGNDYKVTFVLGDDGEYAKITYKNGILSSGEDGTWEIDGGDVLLHEDGNTKVATRYEYDGEALVNNDHKFYKK
jgi:hypothetical protein